MKIQPINIYDDVSKPTPANNTSFKARLRLTFPESSIPCNYNRGEANFSRVIREFRNWLSSQSPFNETLTISKKMGKEVNVMHTKRNGVFQGGAYVDKDIEDLEFSMGRGRSGFCWNAQESESSIVEDFKNTFNYVKDQAGY